MTPILRRLGKIPWGAMPFAALLGIAGAVLATPASATPITATSTFNQSNIFPSSPTQDWGTLTISCDAGTCSVSLTVDNALAFFDNNFLAFDLNGGAGTPTLDSTFQTAHQATLNIDTQNGIQVDGFGSFTYAIDLFDGPNNGVPQGTTELVFAVAFAGSPGDLLVNNSSGWDAAGHFLAPGGTCTGFAGESVGGTSTKEGSQTNCGTVPPPPVPEPGTLALIGIGILGLSLIMRRRREA
jgi:hypothetical protein